MAAAGRIPEYSGTSFEVGDRSENTFQRRYARLPAPSP